MSDMPRPPSVTITTVLYNSASSMPRYCSTLKAAVDDVGAHLLIVDNASPDDSAQQLRAHLPEARLLSSHHNRGFAGGCNLAWPHVTSRYWLLLNPDVEFPPGALAKLVWWMDTHPTVAAVTPKLELATGIGCRVVRPHDTLWRPVVELLRLHRLLPQHLRARLLLPVTSVTIEEFSGWIPGAAMMVRTAAVQEVGLLDDSLFMYGEDREWCWRMARAGWRMGVCHEVTARHTGGTSAKATWGNEGSIVREVEGHLRVTRRLRGRAFTQALAAITALSLRLGALDPRTPRTDARSMSVRSSAYARAVLHPPGVLAPDLQPQQCQADD